MFLICHPNEFGWRCNNFSKGTGVNFKKKNRRRLESILSFFFGDFWITACIIYIGRGICFVDELFRWMFYWFLKVSLPVRRIALWMEQIEIDPVYSHILKCISNTKIRAQRLAKLSNWPENEIFRAGQKLISTANSRIKCQYSNRIPPLVSTDYKCWFWVY